MSERPKKVTRFDVVCGETGYGVYPRENGAYVDYSQYERDLATVREEAFKEGALAGAKMGLGYNDSKMRDRPIECATLAAAIVATLAPKKEGHSFRVQVIDPPCLVCGGQHGNPPCPGMTPMGDKE